MVRLFTIIVAAAAAAAGPVFGEESRGSIVCQYMQCCHSMPQRVFSVGMNIFRLYAFYMHVMTMIFPYSITR